MEPPVAMRKSFPAMLERARAPMNRRNRYNRRAFSQTERLSMNDTNMSSIPRRRFLQHTAALAAAAGILARPGEATSAQPAPPAPPAPPRADKLIGIQIGAVSFVD